MRRAPTQTNWAPIIVTLGIFGLALALILVFTLKTPSAGYANIQLDIQLGPSSTFVPASVAAPTSFPVAGLGYIISQLWDRLWGEGSQTPSFELDSGPARHFGTLALTSVGNSRNADVSELSYMVSSIVLCEGLTASSAYAFSDPTGSLLTLYNSSLSLTTGTFAVDLGSVNSTLQYDVAQANATKFSNFMNVNVRRAFGNNPTQVLSSGIGVYHYAIINWYSMTKFKGSITLADGTLLQSSPGEFVANQWVAPNMSATLTTNGVQLLSVGTWSRMINVENTGFVLNQTDINRNREYMATVILNTDYRFKGFNDRSACSGCNIIETSSTGDGIYLPPLDVSIIMHPAGTRVVCEQYFGTPIDYAANKFKILVELFYLISDQTKAVRGIHTDTVYTADTILNYMTFPPVRYITNSDAAATTTTFSSLLNFWSYDNVYVLIDSFSRQSTIGHAANATINCVTNYFTTASCTTGTQFNASFVLTSRNYVN